MTMQNPVALAANTVRQLGETANQTVQSLGNQLAATSSTLLSGLAGGSGPLALPGISGANGGGLLPAPQQLVPTQALQALSQLENAVLPAGLPRPAAMLLQASAGVTAAMNGNGRGETRAPTPSTAGIPADRRSPGTEGLNGVSQRTRARGVQLV